MTTQDEALAALSDLVRMAQDPKPSLTTIHFTYEKERIIRAALTKPVEGEWIPEGEITKRCGLSYVGEMGSAFYEHDGRVFVCLTNGVHEMIDGVPCYVEPTPPQNTTEVGDDLKEDS